jgi:hypothetical protein
MEWIFGSMFEIFPKLQEYETKCHFLNLRNVPSKKLATIVSCKKDLFLINQPPLADFHQKTFESDVTELVLRLEEIIHLNIGRDEWIEQRIGLSIDFWKNMVNISLKLKSIVIYNSKNVSELVQVLIDCKHNINSLTIRTNADGFASVAEMPMPSWLKIIDNVE